MMLLKPFELSYRVVTRIKRRLYTSGLLKARRLERPVISIGNLTFGGSGKTPAVITIARQLARDGMRVAVLSRGYGRRGRERHALVREPDSFRFGDEPSVIKSLVPQIDVVVGTDRFAAGTWYLLQNDADMFLLDDGFQHLRLARDLDIVIHQPGARWLREGPSALRSADVVFLRGEADLDLATPVFRVSLRPQALETDGKREEIEVLRGARVIAYAGLGDNDQFFDTLATLGATLVRRYSFGDHHRYSNREIQSIVSKAASEQCDRIVTTRKDWIRFPAPDVTVLDVELEIDRSSSFFEIVHQALNRAEFHR